MQLVLVLIIATFVKNYECDGRFPSVPPQAREAFPSQLLLGEPVGDSEGYAGSGVLRSANIELINDHARAANPIQYRAAIENLEQEKSSAAAAKVRAAIEKLQPNDAPPVSRRVAVAKARAALDNFLKSQDKSSPALAAPPIAVANARAAIATVLQAKDRSSIPLPVAVARARAAIENLVKGRDTSSSVYAKHPVATAKARAAIEKFLQTEGKSDATKARVRAALGELTPVNQYVEYTYDSPTDYFVMDDYY